MSATCQQTFSLTVIDPCTLLTSAQWQNTPGLCRLRIKNFNALDWLGECPGCVGSGLPSWDGTFSVYQNVVGIHFFNIGNGFSLGGKKPFGPVNIFCDVFIIAGSWGFEISCDNGGGATAVWVGTGPAAASTPMGVYGKTFGCIPNPTMELEAYTP